MIGDIDGAVWASALAGAILIGTLVLTVLMSMTATARMSRNFHHFMNMWGQNIRETGELTNDLTSIVNAVRSIVTDQRGQIDGMAEHSDAVMAHLSSMRRELMADGARTRDLLTDLKGLIERW